MHTYVGSVFLTSFCHPAVTAEYFFFQAILTFHDRRFADFPIKFFITTTLLSFCIHFHATPRCSKVTVATIRSTASWDVVQYLHENRKNALTCNSLWSHDLIEKAQSRHIKSGKWVISSRVANTRGVWIWIKQSIWCQNRSMFITAMHHLNWRLIYWPLLASYRISGSSVIFT